MKSPETSSLQYELCVWVRTAFAKRAFHCSAPATWNSLPRTVTDNDSLATFKSRLETFMFSLAFN